VHVLCDLRECAERHLPELRRRIGASAEAAAQDGSGFEVGSVRMPAVRALDQEKDERDENA
jgi:hypothetical protein